MVKRRPIGRERLSWLLVIFWSGLIFVSVPFVRAGVNYVRQHWGAAVFTYLVAACVVLVLAAAVALLLKRRQNSLAGNVWLAAISGVVIYQIFDLQAGSPVEAVHFLQYGLLSLLLFRAFAHRVRDYSIYAAATISGSFVGMIDETVQWLTPGRVFDLADIWLNFTAVALVQIALAAGIRPRRISGWPDGLGLRRLCRLGAVATAFLGLCYLNTPDRIAWFSARMPLPDFVASNNNVMVEYGYLHDAAPQVIFRSRLTIEALRRLAGDRALEGARVLDLYRAPERFSDFLDAYTPMNDPFFHEAGVRLHSRDVYLQRARDATDNDWRRRQFTSAYWENRILESYFGGLLLASSARWPSALEVEITEKIDTEEKYESWVSRHLITKFTRQQALWFFVCAVVGLLLLARFFGSWVPGWSKSASGRTIHRDSEEQDA
jgi:hypothetical protein